MKIVLIVAQSLDGFITRHDEPGVAWASEADQRWFRNSLQQFDCQVMASGTYATVRDHLQTKSGDDCLRIVMTRTPEAYRMDQQTGALEFTNQSPQEILQSLAQANRNTCALLGGSMAHDAFLQAGLVDEIWVTIEPKLFGQGTPVITQQQDQSLKIIDHQRLPDSDSLVIRYRVKR
jgi:dihydrofolate reductase